MNSSVCIEVVESMLKIFRPIIVATRKAKIGRFTVETTVGQSSGDSISTNSWVWWNESVIPKLREEAEIRKITVPGQTGQKVRLYLQNNQSKKGWRHG
jgi:hypothetical protein